LQLESLCKAFGGNKVLRDLSFTLPPRSVTALIGSNGAGKSTALNILSGLMRQDSGRVILKGELISDMPSYQRSRRGIARTFQQPRSFRTLTTLEAVCLARTAADAEGLACSLATSTMFWRPSRSKEEVAHANFYLEQCRLIDRCNTITAELTYGEQKLLMLAQALAFGGDVYCFDEICAGLEPGLIEHVASTIKKLVEKEKTVLFVEHNLELVRQIADRTIFLHEGRVFSHGSTEQVLLDPAVVQLYLGD
jgi:branched-chain amino acid transport system ATP-binding protein